MIGPRNGLARERRRRKFDGGCERDPVSVPQRKLTLKENFGWKVVEMTHVKSSYPQLTMHLEKPDSSGNFKKVTHVLYMDKPVTVVEKRPIVRPEERNKKKEKEEEPSVPEVEQPEIPVSLSLYNSNVNWAASAAAADAAAADAAAADAAAADFGIKGRETAPRSPKMKRDDTPYRMPSRTSVKSAERKISRERFPKVRESVAERDQRLESAREALLRRIREERQSQRAVSCDNRRMSVAVDERKLATRVMFDRIESRDTEGSSNVAKNKTKKSEKGRLSRLVEKGSSETRKTEKRMNGKESKESRNKKERPLRAGASEQELKDVREKETKMLRGMDGNLARKKLKSPMSYSGTSSGGGRRDEVDMLTVEDAPGKKPGVRRSKSARINNSACGMGDEMRISEAMVEDVTRKGLRNARNQRAMSRTSSEGTGTRGKDDRVLEGNAKYVTRKKVRDRNSERSAKRTDLERDLLVGTGEQDALHNRREVGINTEYFRNEYLTVNRLGGVRPGSLSKVRSRSVSCARAKMLDMRNIKDMEKSSDKESFRKEGITRKEFGVKSSGDKYSERRLSGSTRESISNNNEEEKTVERNVGKRSTGMDLLETPREFKMNEKGAEEDLKRDTDRASSVCGSQRKKTARENLTNDETRERTTSAMFSLIERSKWDYDEIVKRKNMKQKQNAGDASVAKMTSGRKACGADEGGSQVNLNLPEKLKTLERFLAVTEVDFGDSKDYETLLKTPSGNNKYLYVPKRSLSRASKTSGRSIA